jgi:PKD repeat protein
MKQNFKTLLKNYLGNNKNVFIFVKIKLNQIISSMKKPFLFIIVLFCVFTVQAQVPTNQDCAGAIQVAQASYYFPNGFSGEGNYPNEIPTTGNCPGNCLQSGEQNSVWFEVNVQVGGTLSFLITPDNTADDFDWAVYNLTGFSCLDIFQNVVYLQSSCNFSADNGQTGATGANLLNCQSAAGNSFNDVIPVQTGETYYIIVSNYSSSAGGFTIDFGNSTAFIGFYTEIYHVESPICGDSSITVSFSDSLVCSTVTPSDFSLSGPGGPYTITSVESSICNTGGNNDISFVFGFSPPLLSQGAYTLCLLDSNVAGSVTNTNGYVSNPHCFNFQAQMFDVQLNSQAATCNLSNGWAEIIPNPTGNYSYVWNTSPISNDSLITGLYSGTYVFTVSNGYCHYTDSVFIESIGNVSVSLELHDELCGLANGWAVAHLSGGSGTYSIDWNTVPPQSGDTLQNLSSGNYIVTVDDGSNCPTISSFTIGYIHGPQLSANIIIPDTNYFAVGSATVIANGTAPFSYEWITTPTQYTQTAINLEGNQSYSVFVTDSVGCQEELILFVPMVSTLDISLSSTPEFCNNSDGTASVIVSNPYGAYSVEWNTSPIQTSTSIINLSTGMYEVTVADQIASITQSVFVNYVYAPIADFNYNVSGYDQYSFINLSTGAASFLWQFGDGNTSTLMNPVYTYSSPNTYIVVLNAYNGSCTTSTSQPIVVSNTSEFFINQMSVYPNPVDDVLHIVLDSPCNGDVDVLIYDVKGQLVLSKKINQQETKLIAVDALPGGMYVLKLFNSDRFYNAVFFKQ